MQTEPRFYFIERSVHARLEIKRMQSVQQQKIGNEWILRELIDQLRRAG